METTTAAPERTQEEPVANPGISNTEGQMLESQSDQVCVGSEQALEELLCEIRELGESAYRHNQTKESNKQFLAKSYGLLCSNIKSWRYNDEHYLIVEWQPSIKARIDGIRKKNNNAGPLVPLFNLLMPPSQEDIPQAFHNFCNRTTRMWELGLRKELKVSEFKSLVEEKGGISRLRTQCKEMTKDIRHRRKYGYKEFLPVLDKEENVYNRPLSVVSAAVATTPSISQPQEVPPPVIPENAENSSSQSNGDIVPEEECNLQSDVCGPIARVRLPEVYWPDQDKDICPRCRLLANGELEIWSLT